MAIDFKKLDADIAAANANKTYPTRMEMITFTSSRGLVVSIPVSEYNDMLLSADAESVRASVLSDAGRALKHRRILADFYNQSLTDSERAHIRAHAIAIARQDAVYSAAFDLGYGEYVNRVAAGRPVPQETWARIMERVSIYQYFASDDTQIEPTQAEIAFAMGDLGYLNERSSEYSSMFTKQTWKISAPDGWNGQSCNHDEAIV